MMMPQLDVRYYATQVFWLSVFFIAVYAFSALVFLPFLRRKQRARHSVIAHNLELAERLLEDSKKIRNDIDGLVAKVNADACSIRAEAESHAQHMVEEQLELSRKMFREYLVSAQSTKEQQMKQMEEQLPNIVACIKEELLAILLNRVRCVGSGGGSHDNQCGGGSAHQ